MIYNSDRALRLLRAGSGKKDAEFRDAQEDAIRHIVEGQKERLLVVQKTGWGKSFVYFIAAKLLREGGAGPTVLISPLVALMRDQVAAAKKMGLNAKTANSSNKDEWPEIVESIQRGELDVLLFHPKQLVSKNFNADLLGPIAASVAFMVIDEAHCISDWGHDFVPEYRLVSRTAQNLPANLRLLATTATANKRVIKDLELILGPNLRVTRGDLVRPSITLQTIVLKSEEERLAWLAERMLELEGSGIVYASTIAQVKRIEDWLRYLEIDVRGYTGASGESRPQLEQDLQNNEVKALIATSALGMGYDKPDLAFVIHYQAPGSVVAYYQQVGRAGRAIPDAYGVLLDVENDVDINEFFINSAFPKRKEVRLVLKALEENDEGLSISEFPPKVNMAEGRIQKTIAALALESPPPIVLEEKKWKLTAAKLSDEFWDRIERVTTIRRSELKQMKEYIGLKNGHMEYLVNALDGDITKIAAPRQKGLQTKVDPIIVKKAVAFMRRSSLPIIPRKKWPTGGLQKYNVKGMIKRDFQADEGRSLSMWGDAGWGNVVKAARYDKENFGEDLVDACIKLIREWGPKPFPTWVTCIPSQRHPRLVPSFAQRIADELGIPFHAALEKTLATEEQKGMANSSQQANNLDGSLVFIEYKDKSGPVLLIDDIVNSGWTFTIGAWVLLNNGCGNVFPLALAKTGNEE